MIPEIFNYIVVGYIAVAIFYFIALKEQINDVEHVVLQSFVVGKVIWFVMNQIPFHISYTADFFGICIFTFCMAVIAGKFIQSKIFISICSKFNITNEINKYYLDSLQDKYPIKIEIVIENIKYSGWCHRYENNKRNPFIVLAAYQIIDMNDGKILEDYTNNNGKVLVVKTDAAVTISVTYSSGSKERVSIGELVVQNKNFNENNKKRE